ncbi:MAG TPA: MarR family transcriptional regulator [Candidatus Limnocylindrales bacterium]|nr:MarR family transcriptional regulator [Candidatus Limnocylindrales bacterium]
MPNQTATRASHAEEIAATVAAFARLMDRVAAEHEPPADVSISMPQLRCLHLIAGAGELRMSKLVAQLGVSISTVSGLVDRLVDHGFVSRHDDPNDRRQVVLSPTSAGIEFLDRMRELSNAQFRGLIELLTPEELRTVRRSIEILTVAADRAGSSAAHDPRKDPR